jgi:hypothetical protein
MMTTGIMSLLNEVTGLSGGEPSGSRDAAEAACLFRTGWLLSASNVRAAPVAVQAPPPAGPTPPAPEAGQR